MTRPVALVTGAARRIGRAIALELAANGFDVAVHYRSSEADARTTVAALQSAGAAAQTFQADLVDEAACRALVPAVVERFGRLDAVVNSASIFEPDDVASFSAASMEEHWRANTAPAVLLARALHLHLGTRTAAVDPRQDAPFDPERKAEPGAEPGAEPDTERNPPTGPAPFATGCVVNIVDQKLWNQNPDFFSYTLSKAALQTATVMLAQALAPQVRVCGVAPGITLASGSMSGPEFDAAHRMTPLQRSSTPDDIARAVRFLIESPAITGTTLLVDGGQHLSAQPRDVLFLARND